MTNTMKLWHWKSHWNFLWHWKDTETTLKNIYKGNHCNNPGLSHWNIFLCCSRTLKSNWKMLNHTEKISALPISFVPRFFSVTLDFQCNFQGHNFIVEQLPKLCENMFACRKASFCWLQKNCTVQWVARYLHGYLEFAESLFTLDWQLHLSINEYVSYTAVTRTKLSFQWYKDLYIQWFASKLWSEEESTNASVLHRKVGEITNETWVLKINGGCYEYLTAVFFRYSNR